MKQRLLGAAVLIILAVIFLPMFFSGPVQTPSNENISLEIPPVPDRDLQSRTYPVNPLAAAGAQATSVARSHVATVTIPDAPPPPPQPSQVSVPVTPAPVSVASTAKAKPEPTRPTPAAPKPVTTAGRAAQQRFAVSVGVFADDGSVKQRVARAKALGYDVYTEQLSVDGKVATGVRVGPFRDRAAAEVARLKLKGAMHGSKPSLLAYSDDQTHAPPASAAAHKQAAGWAVQLAAFSQRADADKLRARARALGFDAYVDDVKTGSGTLWRVRVGPRAERSDAQSLAAKLKAKMAIAGMVVTTP